MAKWLILFQVAVANISPRNVSYMGRAIPQSHDSKISRPSTSFMIDRTQLKFQNH